MVGNRLGDVEEELADQGFCLNRAQPLGEPRGIVDIQKYQDLLLDHRAVIGAHGQVKQGFDTDEMYSSHHNDADDGKRNHYREQEWQPAIWHWQLVKWP